MRAIIDGKRYDTETATLVAGIDGAGCSRSDFRWEDTGIYVTKNDNWFLAGEGGPRTRWARSVGDGTSGGSGLRPISPSTARKLLEGLGQSEALETYFGSEIEDA
jgi:hypothetical protein